MKSEVKYLFIDFVIYMYIYIYIYVFIFFLFQLDFFFCS